MTTDISKAGKDELAEYAKTELDLILDMTKPLAKLRAEVRAITEKATDAQVEGPPLPPRFLKHPDNGRVFEATPILLGRGDMLPCTEDGALI